MGSLAYMLHLAVCSQRLKIACKVRDEFSVVQHLVQPVAKPAAGPLPGPTAGGWVAWPERICVTWAPFLNHKARATCV